jgi:large subunit ribosomal protein L6
MSRIGKKPVPVPAGVTATSKARPVGEGPKGTLSMTVLDELVRSVEDGQISVQPATTAKRSRAASGACSAPTCRTWSPA